MFTPAPQAHLQPNARCMPARVLTSSIKRSVLSLSMRFSYDARIRSVVSAGRFAGNAWTVARSTTPVAKSVQEFQLTRITPKHA